MIKEIQILRQSIENEIIGVPVHFTTNGSGRSSSPMITIEPEKMPNINTRIVWDKEMVVLYMIEHDHYEHREKLVELRDNYMTALINDYSPAGDHEPWKSEHFAWKNFKDVFTGEDGARVNATAEYYIDRKKITNRELVKAYVRHANWQFEIVTDIYYDILQRTGKNIVADEKLIAFRNKWMTKPEVMQELKISLATLDRLLKNRILPKYTIGDGGSVRIKSEDVHKIMVCEKLMDK